MMLQTTIRALLVACVTAWPAVAFGAVAGVFQFVAGEVQVLSANGAAKPARKGTPLSVGETVQSEKSGTAQIKMGDGAVVVVQPGTRVTVVDFRYEGREDGSERVRYRLEQGGFRAITGAIGRTNKDNYLIETPIAQMGVRGTDHESYYFAAPQPSNGGFAQPGVYNKVNVGLVFIRTDAGEVVVAPNQVGYAASGREMPALLAGIPGFFNGTVGPQTRVPSRPSTGEAALAERAALKVTQDVVTAGGVTLSGGTAGAGSTGGGGSTGSGGGGMAGGGSGGVVGFDPGGGSSAARSGVNLAVVANGAPLANIGGDSTWGVNWGTWMGGLATVAGNATSGGTHFMNSTQLTSAAQLAAMPAMMVTATYSGAAGPAPTNQAGTAGTINSLSVGVNFGSQQITSYNLNSTVGAANWTASGSGSFAQFSGTSGIALSGSCSGCAGSGTPTASGTAHGQFVGGAAEKMMTSFGLKAANQSVSGAALLSR